VKGLLDGQTVNKLRGNARKYCNEALFEVSAILDRCATRASDSIQVNKTATKATSLRGAAEVSRGSD
jgi:hypothetical protein